MRPSFLALCVLASLTLTGAAFAWMQGAHEYALAGGIAAYVLTVAAVARLPWPWDEQ